MKRTLQVMSLATHVGALFIAWHWSLWPVFALVFVFVWANNLALQAKGHGL